MLNLSHRSDLLREEVIDVLVLGSGMSGATAALAATRKGASVTVLEKAAAPGGSAALSAGMFWTAPTYEALRRRIPLGDPTLGKALIDNYMPTLHLVRSTGVEVAAEATLDIMTYGVGYSFDVASYLNVALRSVADAGNSVILGAKVLELTGDYDRMNGATVRLASGEIVQFRARSTVLATGGFQGDREMLHRYIGPNADRLLRRSNPESVGDGLRLALSAGSAATGAMSSFYGHLIPYPVATFEPADFLPYAQYYSGETLIVNLRGERFVDETLGDELINQDLARQPEARAVMIFDDRIRNSEARKEPFPGTGLLDRLQIAIDAGANYLSAGSLDEIVDGVASWGVDRGKLNQTVGAYATAIAERAPFALGIPISARALAPQEAPFHALAVQPSVTFTFGGIRIDDSGRALTRDGEPIPGLYAAGADIGGLSNYGYAGGLAPAAVTGAMAGYSAAADARAFATSQERR